ncbi:5'-3' exonuclease [Thioalkalivibrio paradoxus]|uniref:5'-3' exonuclease n=1 Tax=Thioalkalivibrio paradoxus ARh 1 TaxID=713585 RepID=W0DQS6_9GAMM|nr:5'-3' exonuclease H3TH domain-containing protein [Thioalkalivibrio paradoxus]AHE99607.1 5'-3' exonuclease [Thioalkalivibrio paradoxus ARh 1]
MSRTETPSATPPAAAGERVATLVDSSIFVFRAWFARGEQPDMFGRPGGAVHGFAHSLCQWLPLCPAGPVAFAFDTGLRSSFRHRIDPDYKAHRPPAPDALRSQFGRIREMLDALGLVQLAHSEFEADDLIATLAANARTHGLAVDVLSADKDLAQVILGPDDRLRDPERGTVLGRADLERRLRVRPEQVADLLALAGDRSDNIRGLTGVGPASAARILRRLGDLEAVLAAPQEVARCRIRGAAGIARQVADRADALRQARRLTALVTTVPDLPDPDALYPQGPLPDAERRLHALGVAPPYRSRLLAIAADMARRHIAGRRPQQAA